MTTFHTSKSTTARTLMATALAALITVGASPAFAAGGDVASARRARAAYDAAEKAAVAEARGERAAKLNRKRHAETESREAEVARVELAKVERVKARRAKAARKAHVKEARESIVLREARAQGVAAKAERTVRPRPNPKAAATSIRARITKENSKHARRVSMIERIMDLAAGSRDRELLAFAKGLMNKEAARHSRFMKRFAA